MSSKTDYKDSRERIVFSEIGYGNEGIRKHENGEIVHLELVVSEPSDKRMMFKEVNTNSVFMTFNDSPSAMMRLFENYEIQKGGKIVGDFEIFWNGTVVDLLVPKK